VYSIEAASTQWIRFKSIVVTVSIQDIVNDAIDVINEISHSSFFSIDKLNVVN